MIRSIKLAVLYLFIGAIFVYGCRSGDVSPLPPDYVTLQAGASQRTSSGLTVKVDSVRVFICPANADCFAPNSATVLLRLSSGSQSQSVRLFTWIPNYNRQPVPNSLPDSTSLELGGQRYKVILRDGRYPNASESQQSGVALVQVSPF